MERDDLPDGYVLVKRDRLERLIHVGQEMWDWADEDQLGILATGDLDPIEPIHPDLPDDRQSTTQYARR